MIYFSLQDQPISDFMLGLALLGEKSKSGCNFNCLQYVIFQPESSDDTLNHTYKMMLLTNKKKKKRLMERLNL